MQSAWRSAAITMAAAAFLVACTSNPCAPIPPSPDCPDLKLYGIGFNEWREFYGPPVLTLQEHGDATYPACNIAPGCPGSEFEGFGATDVWVMPGVDPADAVIGIRQNSDVLVIFIRVGVDADRLPLPG